MQQRIAVDRSSVAQIEESRPRMAQDHISRRQLLHSPHFPLPLPLPVPPPLLPSPAICVLHGRLHAGGHRRPGFPSRTVPAPRLPRRLHHRRLLRRHRHRRPPLGVRRRSVPDADAAGAQPGAHAVAPVPARQGPLTAARRAPVRLLPRLPPAALAAASGGGLGTQRVVETAAAVPVLLCRHPPRPRALAAPRRRWRRHHEGCPGVGPRPRVHARDHHRRRDAAARGPVLRLRPEPRAVHRVEPPAAHAAAPGPRPGRGPHVRLHGPARHQPHRTRRRGRAASVPVLHDPRPPGHPVPGLVLLGLAGDAHRAVEPRVPEHQAGRKEGAVAGPGAHRVLEGQPGRCLAAPARPPHLQRHQPVASRDRAAELGGGGQVRLPELEAVEPVHAPVQDLRGGVRLVGEPEIHPLLRLHGAADRPAVRGLLQPGPGAAGEPPAGERGGDVRVHQGRRGVGQRAPGRGGARRAARAAADAGPGHGRRLRLHAAPAHRVRRAAGLHAVAGAHGAGGLRRLRALPRRRAPEGVPGGVRRVAGHRRTLLHAAAASRRLTTDQSEAAIQGAGFIIHANTLVVVEILNSG